MRWSHLTFTFENITASTNVQRGFRYTFYVNGRMDLSAFFPGQALQNDGPLYFARDPWGSLGKFRGYVFGIRIFGKTLSAEAAHFVHLSAQRPLPGLQVLAQNSALLPLLSPEDNRKASSDIDEQIASLRTKLSSCRELPFGLAEVLAIQDICIETARAGEPQYVLALAHLGLLEGQEQQCVGFDTPNVVAASKCLAEASKLGHGAAMRLLGQMIGTGMINSDHSILLLGSSEESQENKQRNKRIRPEVDRRKENTLGKRHEVASVLYHGAALRGDVRAKLALADRYLEGSGVVMDIESTAFYFHAVGKAAQLE